MPFGTLQFSRIVTIAREWRGNRLEGVPALTGSGRCNVRFMPRHQAVDMLSFRYFTPLMLLLLTGHAMADGRDAARVQLGARLFFDAALSQDGSVSCAHCHVPEKAFADGLVLAKGVGGQSGTRNTPSLLNLAGQRSFFWDGRRTSLQAQALDPFIDPREHGLRNVEALLRQLRADEGYRQAFRVAFGSGAIRGQQVGEVLARFQLSLQRADSPFDRHLAGDKSALSSAASRGLALFSGPAQCASCHSLEGSPAALSDGRFHALGVAGGAARAEQLPQQLRKVLAAPQRSAGEWLQRAPELAPLGRFLVTRKLQDIGAFKTPGLRHVALTAPYMHDGSIATLEQAVDHEIYYRGTKDGRLLILTPDERNDLVAFLHALTSPNLDQMAAQVRRIGEVRSP